MPQETGGPYLAAALFCEKVLREGDGVLSLIRVVDRWTVNGPSDQMPVTVIQTNLVIIAKSGMHRGSSNVTVTPIAPSGEKLPTLSFPVLFEGDDDRGIGIAAGMGFPVSEHGVYWFEVFIDGQLTTRVPLRVIYLRAGPSVATPSS